MNKTMKRTWIGACLMIATVQQVSAQWVTVGETKKTETAAASVADVGKLAINFSQADATGKQVSYASLKGKYILLTFWESSNKASRDENKELLKPAYERLKNKNFEIVSVSLDDKKEAWLQAVKEDGLPWVNVNDLQGWKNKIAVDYGVKSIPMNFLIDPRGNIVGMGAHGKDLQKDLDELVGKGVVIMSSGRTGL